MNRHNSEDNRRRRGPVAWGLAGTLLFHGALLLVLLLTFLRYPPRGMEEFPPEQPREIVFDEVEDIYASGEFVRTGDTFDSTVNDEAAPSSADEPEPSQDAPDLKDAGPKGDPSKLVSTEKESPMKVSKKPKGPSKEDEKREEARREAQRREQAKKTAADATKKAFGGKGKGQSGQTDGNSSKGAVSGTPGNGVAGRTLEHWDRVASTKIGEIAIRVKVDSQGKVVSASYDPSRSNGAVAGDTRMREACRRKSLECRFSVKEGAPTASGVITWRFR